VKKSSRAPAAPRLETAGIVLNRKNSCLRKWLKQGQLRGLEISDLRLAIEENLPDYNARGQQLAHKRLDLLAEGRPAKAARR
jgi:hypothetical protein